MRKLSLIFLVIFLLIQIECLASKSITLVGHNGVSVEFEGALEAIPQGLIVRLSGRSDDTLVAWKKFDLDKLKKHSEIYRAYLLAIEHEKTTRLNLGIFKDRISIDEFKEKLNLELEKKFSIVIPNMKTFYINNDIEKFYKAKLRDNRHIEKQSEKFLRYYFKLLAEFFSLRNPELELERVTWKWSNGLKFRLVKDAKPKNIKAIKISSKYIIEYMANDKKQYRNKIIIYFNNHQSVLEKPINILKSHVEILKLKVESNDESKISRLKYLINNVIEDLENMNKQKTREHRAIENLKKLLRELN